MVIVSLSERLDIESLKQIAAAIRLLPTVLRVRVDWDSCKLEILHQHPTEELIEESIFYCCRQVIVSRRESQ